LKGYLLDYYRSLAPKLWNNLPSTVQDSLSLDLDKQVFSVKHSPN